MTCNHVSLVLQTVDVKKPRGPRRTYGNTVVVLLANALSLGLALLEGVLVLELGTHVGRCSLYRSGIIRRALW